MDGELLSLKWNNHRTTFYHVISGLRNKETYTDVTLACEGKFYPVHKLVLSTCSEYFSDIFDRTPCKNPVVVLKDINCQDLEFLLDYMYIGEVNVRQNELSSLIKAAECLRIKGLAVPDEEPKKSTSTTNSVSNNAGSSVQGRQRPEQATPPAKRRRAEERRMTEQSPGRPPGDSSPDHESGQACKTSASDSGRTREQVEDKQSDIGVEQPAVHIKVEQHDNYEQSANDDFLVQSNSYDGGGGGGGGGEEGDGPHSSEGNTNDFPEFLQSTVEKEEPVAMSDFNPSDFPGPSGLQNSGMAPWESENSSASFAEGLSGAVAAAVAAVSQPQQQRQQQQLWVCRPPWVSGRERWDSEVNTKLEDSQMISQATHTHSEEVPRSSRWLQAALQKVYRGSQLTHKCPYCPYTSQLSSNVRRHVRTHTGEMPYSCPQCDFRCKDASSMKRHQTTHTRHTLLPTPSPANSSAQT